MIHLYPDSYSAIKRNELSMQQPGWIFWELCWVEKKKNHKRLHTVWFHLYYILEITNYRNGGQISGCQGLRRGWRLKGSECGNKRATWRILVGIEMVCITIKVLVVILLDYSFARCYHWWKLNKRYKGSLFIVSYKDMWNYSYLQIKSVKNADCRVFDSVSIG